VSSSTWINSIGVRLRSEKVLLQLDQKTNKTGILKVCHGSARCRSHLVLVYLFSTSLQAML
jgi:hypothetical protein